MSKTLGSILLVAAAVAVNVIPGIGQAISAGIIGLGGGTFAAAGVAFSVTNALIAGVTLAALSAGIGLAGSVLAGNPAGRADTTESARKSPIPARTRAYGALRLYGDWLLFGHKPDGTPVDVWAFHDGRASAVTQIYLNDDKITRSGTTVQAMADGRYRDNKVRCGYNLGLPTETAFADVINELPGIWTADHRGDGIVTGYLIKYLQTSGKFLETYPNGDDIQMSLAGQWSVVFDFRDEAQDAYDPSTWAYRDNPVLAFLHREITQGGLDFDTQVLPQIDKWTAAADDCDAAMALAAGGTEPRYRLALAYKATETPAAVRLAILNTFDGWYCENERGELIIYSGRFYEPTVSIGPDQISAYSIQRHVAAEDAVNEVLITYVSAEHEYATVDADSWRNQAAIDASGREPVTIGLDAQIPSPTQGRRLAKRRMIRANSPCRGSVVTTFGGRVALGERFINLKIEEAGAVFYDGPVEIVGSPERDMQTGGVRFDWIAIGPEIDDWDPEEETGDATPIGELPDIEPLPDPEITSAVVNFDSQSGAGSPGAYLVLTIDAPDRDDLQWTVRTKLSTATIWGAERQYSDIDPGSAVIINTEYVPVDTDVDVAVAYATGDGRRSDWSATVTVSTITGDSYTDPDLLALFARMSPAPDGARKSLIASTILNLKLTGLWWKCDAIYFMAAHDVQAALLNWKGATHDLTTVGAQPTFTTDRGFQGNGSSQVLSTGFAPGSGQTLQDSNHLSVWSLSNTQVNTAEIGGTLMSIAGRSAADTFTSRSSNTVITSAANTVGNGLFTISRTNSADYARYHDGSLFDTQTQASASLAGAAAIYICGRNTGGTPGYSTKQVAVATIGGGLTAAEQSALYNIERIYLQAVGAI